MDKNLLIFGIIFSCTFHFIIQKIFIYFKRFDDHNHRSSHKTLATRTGGIGVYITPLLVSLYYYFKKIELFDYSLFIPLSIMFVVGVYDDLYRANFKLKFLMQIIVAKILIDQGFVISNFYGLFGLYEVPRVLSQLSTVFVFLVVVNAFNFIDGIDGLAISQVIKSILIFEIFSKTITPISILGFLIFSSTLPLYYFNFKKSRKIFLGDSGSMFLGTLLMIYILFILSPDFNFEDGLKINKVLFSVILVLYPLIDLLRIFIIRIKNGKSPFIADNNHIHHKVLSYYNGNHLKTLITILLLELAILTLLIVFFK